MSWTVDGVGGGSTEVGTVDAHGLYVAPAAVPPSGQATIRATTASGAFDEVTIAITERRPPQPAPAIAAEQSKPTGLVQVPVSVPLDPRSPRGSGSLRLANGVDGRGS